jgi:hypothetical protein
MGTFDYQVIRRQNGWGYRLEETYSPIFGTQAEAIAEAKKAAQAMHEEGDFTRVRVEEAPLTWRTEFARGTRPVERTG